MWTCWLTPSGLSSTTARKDWFRCCAGSKNSTTPTTSFIMRCRYVLDILGGFPRSKMVKNRLWVVVVLAIVAMRAASSRAQTKEAAVKESSPCAKVPHDDHPKEMLSNGKLDVLVFLPDKNDGYYRSTRFDWSGVVPCVSLNGHRFFGEWFADYDPLKNDAITGPVEEFRTNGGPAGHTGPRGEFV